jgi:gamma-butyrobetaine dioxygenase
MSAELVSADVGQRALTVRWADGTTSTFHHLWLRDNCPQLRHATTNHRVAETSEIPGDVHPSAAVVDAGGNLAVTWAHDGHISTFTPSWLRAYDYSNGARSVAAEPVLWDSTIGDAMPTVAYAALVDDPAERRRFLAGFCRFGVGIFRDIPSQPGTVLELGDLLGEVRVTSWGRSFDVISMDDANSVAYTNLPLVLHTDEGYRDPAPSIQLQHFLRADASGGEATLVDGFKVAADLRAAAPEQFALLASTSLHFHFADATAEHEHRGPVIELDTDGRVKAVRFSNHSAQPFLMDADRMEPYYEAYRAFGRMRESSRYKLCLEMKAGDGYIVDNRRVMHGRTAFSSGGARHLQSCYIERDELVSRLAVLNR